MKKSMSAIIALILLAIPGMTQVAISTNSGLPDPSSMLDIRSNAKGLLIPRLTTADRTSIAVPADGLQVYDTDTKSIWFYKTGTGAGWKELKVLDRVAFRAYLAADVLYTGSTIIVFGAEDFDDGNNFTSGTFGYFTAPANGVYSFQVNTTVNNAGSLYQVSIYYYPVGGGSSRIITNIVRPTSLGFDVSTNLAFTLKLNANDILRAWLEPVGNATLKGGSDKTWWSGFRVH